MAKTPKPLPSLEWLAPRLKLSRALALFSYFALLILLLVWNLAFADLHGAHVVAGLIVAYPVPARFAELFQAVDREFVGLGFHQPVGHCWAPEKGIGQVVGQLHDKPTVGWRQGLRVGSRYRRMRAFKLDAAATDYFGTLLSSCTRCLKGGQSMQRKPDLLWILVILFGLGVVTTGYAQSLWSNKTDAPVELAQQQPQPFKR